MVILFSILLLLSPDSAPRGVDAETIAATALESVEHAYALAPRASLLVDAQALITRWPGTSAAGRACLWLGALALEQGRLRAARGWYGEARTRFPQRDIAALALRGLGDVDLREGANLDAIVAYGQARAVADPTLAIELRDKIALARGAHGRWLGELGCWVFALACFLWFAIRLRGRRLALPLETRALAPVYALLLVAALGRDPNALRALAIIAVASLLLVTVAFAGGLHRRLAPCLALSAATLAIVYIGLQRAGMTVAVWNALLRRG